MFGSDTTAEVGQNTVDMYIYIRLFFLHTGVTSRLPSPGRIAAVVIVRRSLGAQDAARQTLVHVPSPAQRMLISSHLISSQRYSQRNECTLQEANILY